MDGWWVVGLRTEGGNLEILHFLPWSWKSTMGPCNSSFLSNIAIFHFHDYGKKGTCYRWVRNFRTIWVDVKPRPEFLRQSQSGVLCSTRNMTPTYFGVGADNKNVLMNRKCSNSIVAYNGGWWWMTVPFLLARSPLMVLLVELTLHENPKKDWVILHINSCGNFFHQLLYAFLVEKKQHEQHNA